MSSKPLTSEDERICTPQLSSSAFFRAIDEFCSAMTKVQAQISLRIGEALIYGEVASSINNILQVHLIQSCPS
jgi:biotin--protein ligase